MMSERLRRIALLMVLILAVAPLAQADSTCDFSFSNYARAVQLHDMGDYVPALQHYHCALEEDPDDAIIPILIANVYDDIENASSAWSMRQATDVVQAPATTSLSLSLGKNARPILDDRGEREVRTSASAEPSTPAPDTLWQAAETFAAHGEFALALDQYQALLGFEPNNSQLHFSIAVAWHALDQPRNALPHLQRSLELFPNHLYTQYFLAITYSQLDRRAEALALTDELFSSHRDDFAWSLVMAHVYGNLGYDAIAGRQYYEWLRQIERLRIEAELRDDLTTLPLDLGHVYQLRFATVARHKVEISARSHNVNRQPIDPLIVLLDPDGLPIAGDDDGGELFDAALSFTAERSGWYTLLLSHAGGNPTGDLVLEINDATAETAKTIADPGSTAQKTYAQGLYLLAAGRLYTAANTFLAALELNPEHREARCRLGAVYTEWAHYGAALEHFARILERYPHDSCALQQRKAAVKKMMKMFHYHPMTAADFIYHARTYAEVEEWELARDALEMALELDPLRSDVGCELGMIYAQLGDDRSALHQFDRVLAQDALDSCAWSNREALMQRNG